MRWKAFWLEPTEFASVRLRRYASIKDAPCPKADGSGTTHEWDTILFPRVLTSDWRVKVLKDDGKDWNWEQLQSIPKGDPRFGTQCSKCGFQFAYDDDYGYSPDPNERSYGTSQTWIDTLYKGAPDGNLYTWDSAPIGAMRDADWLHRFTCPVENNEYVGPDGIALQVKTPAGEWQVDSQASNCTRTQRAAVPGEPGWTMFTRTHYCWVRHGDPRTGDVHVDKAGNTCAAGAGSILIGKWHGFLHNGYLRDDAG